MKNNKFTSDGWFFLIAIPLVAIVTYFSYGLRSSLGLLLFLFGIFVYFNFFLNIFLVIKSNLFKQRRLMLSVYAALSIIDLLLSWISFGNMFAFKCLLITAILFIVQLIFIRRY